MRPGEEFVQLYNELCYIMKKQTNAETGTSFGELIYAAAKRSATVDRHRSWLKSIEYLRNAIVHDSDKSETIIADPRPEVVDGLRRLVDALTKPVTVSERFRKLIDTFSECDELGQVLAYMEKKDYSQVVVKVKDKHGVLSSEGIVRWLSRARDVGLADLEGATVGAAYVCEDSESCQFLGRYEPLDAAILAFETAIPKRIPRLQAILITHHGRPTEEPLGIITPWDIIGLASTDDLT